MKQQLELFTATIISFPLERRADLVRTTAVEFKSLSREKRQEWWTSHCLSIAEEIRSKTGKSDPELKDDLQRFSDAVAVEINRESEDRVCEGPGAA